MTNHSPTAPTTTTTLEERRRLVVQALLCDDYGLRRQLQTETEWIDEELMLQANHLDAAKTPDEIATLAIELNASICRRTFDL
jgi:hypothetical protein